MRRQVLHERRWPRRRRLRSRLICVIGVAIAASGCGKTVEGTIAQVCGPNGWREITIGKDDHITDPTAREIVGNNKARAAWCNPKGAGA